MDPEIIFILIVILAPLVERLFKAGKQQPPEPPPQRRMEQSEPPVQVRREGRGQDTAATMLPDDLWAILTGEQPAPARLPLPEPPEPEEEEYSLEAASEEDWLEEEESAAAVPAPPRESWRTSSEVAIRRAEFSRPAPDREPPRIVSLEQLDIDDRRRHEEFHERLNRSIQTGASSGSAGLLATPDDLRRAIILNEVLGPPKGLQ